MFQLKDIDLKMKKLKFVKMFEVVSFLFND